MPPAADPPPSHTRTRAATTAPSRTRTRSCPGRTLAPPRRRIRPGQALVPPRRRIHLALARASAPARPRSRASPPPDPPLVRPLRLPPSPPSSSPLGSCARSSLSNPRPALRCLGVVASEIGGAVTVSQSQGPPVPTAMRLVNNLLCCASGAARRGCADGGARLVKVRYGRQDPAALWHSKV